MNKKTNPTEQLLIHACILTTLYFIPITYAFYILLALYLIGIPKSLSFYKEKDTLVAQIENEKHKNARPWHEILGTTETASIEDCRNVRKALSKIYHPDGGSHPNDQHMQRINRALEERIETDKYIETDPLPGIH